MPAMQALPHALPRLAPLDAQDAGRATELHALLQRAYTQEAALLGVDPAQFPPLQHPVHALQAGGEDWIGAWQDGALGAELVGALSLHADADDDAVNCIGALAVDPAHQRRGIATLLLHAAFASQGGRSPFSVQVAQANAPAMALLAQAGFREWRRWSDAVGGQRLRFVKLLRRPS
jgi:ribosomal protein S18 acetylase RimI-like enzyme